MVNVTNHPNIKAHIKILSLIDQGHYKSQIARMTKVSPAAIHKKIKRLLKLGYVHEEKKAYPHILSLTAKGKLALKRNNLTLSGYVRDRKGRPKKNTRPKQGVIRLHNLQIMIPILKEGRPLPIKSSNKLNNWTQKFLDLKAPINATVELTTKNVRIYMHELEVARGHKGYLSLLKIVTQTIFMVHSCLSQFGWIIDTLSVDMPTQHIATTMPEFNNLDLQASELYLGRPAKDLQGKETAQEARAWSDRSKGTLEIESNDAEYMENLQKMPSKIMGYEVDFDEGILMMPEQISRVDANIQHIGRFARSHEQFMVTLATETLPNLNDMLNKINKRLDKL